MKRKGKLFRFRGLLGPVLASASLFSLSACLGGTGTDTENGVDPVLVMALVLTPDGQPVTDLKFGVSHVTSRIDSASESPLKNPNTPLKTDMDGFVNFQLKKPGIYMVEGSRHDSVLFVDTLRAFLERAGGLVPTVLDSIVFRTGIPVRANGRIRLLSGYRPDSGRVVLRGTSLQSIIGSNGSYDLAWLPPSVEKMKLTVAYSARPAETRYVKIAVLDSGLAVLGAVGSGERCLADSATAAAAMDTVNGLVTSVSDLARITGGACQGRTGALIRVLKTDASGTVLEALGRFVVPEPDAVSEGSAVPSECLLPAKGTSERGALNLVAGEILVDDLRHDGDCP